MNEGRVSGSFAGDENWFVAQLKPNALSVARRHLRQQGFQCFGPQRKETRRSGSRIVTRDRPLFPGYLFVQFDPAGLAWRKINATRGVSRLVLGNPRKPTPLPSEFMAGLQARCDDDDRLRQPDELGPGDDVQIISGPFASFISQVEKVTEDERLEVLLDLMGQQMRVSLPQTYVERKHSA